MNTEKCKAVCSLINIKIKVMALSVLTAIEINKKTNKVRLTLFAIGGDNRTRTCDLYDVNVAL